jgi:TolB-like protein/tRNA A-37 threonylcarbamoyl transferase component Bud32/Tfp pilus assembly protein PilF
MTGTPDRLTNALADRYRIERELGAGGMATVYLAHDLKHDRKVAIKVLRPELAASLGSDRFLREVHIAAQLQHPHILTLIDSGEADGFLDYVMPYVEGETLRAKLARDGEFPVADAVRILREVADALAYAHGHGVVHRDVKPENVMLSGRHALVMDFGVAKAVSEATGRQSLTTIGVALGTPTYMAPEQATADPHVDHRADIYALGVMAYELLTGRPPFTGNTPQQVIAAHVTQAPDPVTRHRAAVPAPLAELVMRCLEKKPADRPQSAQQILDRFEELATPSGGMTPTGTAPHRAVRRPRRTLYLGAALFLAVTLGGLWALRRHSALGAAAGPVRLAVVPFDNLGPADQAYFAEGLVDEVRTRLTGLSGLRVIARTSSEAYRGGKHTPQQIGKELGVQYLLTGRVRWQEAAPGRAARVRVSPELIRVEDGTTAWEQSFDADPSDAFAVQSRMAGEVSQALNLALTPQDSSSAGVRPTENAAAYDAYLQGEALLQHAETSDQDGRPAAALFTRAVALDAGFALAWARLSYAYMLTYWDFFDRAEGRLAQATDAAARAQALAPDLPETHLALAYVRYWGHRDYEGARRELDPALRARPNDVKLLLPFSYVARRSGHLDEAIATMRREVDLDPRNPTALDDLANTLNYVQAAGASEPLWERVALLSPQYTSLWADWVCARIGGGNPDRIRDVVRRAEAALGKGFPAWFLTADHYGHQLLIATVADPDFRARLLAGSIAGDLPSDSVGMMTTKAALAKAAGDAAGAARYAAAAWSIAGRLALRDTAESNWHVWMARAALLRGRPDDAVREARRAMEMLPVSIDHVDGPDHLLLLAEAHAMAGHADSALVHLKALQTVPSLMKAGTLRLAPEFVSLRNDPRFVKLLESAPK